MKELARVKAESWIKAALYGLLLIGVFYFLPRRPLEKGPAGRFGGAAHDHRQLASYRGDRRAV